MLSFIWVNSSSNQSPFPSLPTILSRVASKHVVGSRGLEKLNMPPKKKLKRDKNQPTLTFSVKGAEALDDNTSECAAVVSGDACRPTDTSDASASPCVSVTPIDSSIG